MFFVVFLVDTGDVKTRLGGGPQMTHTKSAIQSYQHVNTITPQILVVLDILPVLYIHKILIHHDKFRMTGKSNTFGRKKQHRVVQGQLTFLLYIMSRQSEAETKHPGKERK